MPVDYTDAERKPYSPPTIKKLTLEQIKKLLADQGQSLELLDQELKERIVFLGAQ